MAYTKLFHSILASTIWQEDKDTRILWITMLAMTDQRGFVGASVPGLAKMAGLTRQEADKALKKLGAPDRDSRTPEHEGRRIMPCDGGWMVINHGKYRALECADRRREQVRDAVARHRAKPKKAVIPIDRAAVGPKEPRPLDIAPPPEVHNGSFEQWRATHPAGNEVL